TARLINQGLYTVGIGQGSRLIARPARRDHPRGKELAHSSLDHIGLPTVEVGVRSRNFPASLCAVTAIVRGDFPIEMRLKAFDRLVELIGNLAKICDGFG